MPRKHKTTIKHKKHYRKPRCSPKTRKLSFTCYSQESLIRMKRFWNARHPDAEINSNDPKVIWKSLKSNFKEACRSERCWLQQKFIRDHLDITLRKHTFAPDAPKSWRKKPDTWLNSLDIDRVMQQYEHIYPSFEFIGPSPIDFDKKKLYGSCVWDELCKFDLGRKIREGINKIGVVFNTDPHYKPGEHWIALYIDVKEEYIFFFNSTGEKILPEIYRLVKRIQKQGKALGYDLRFVQNHPFVHQQTTTECGMYVLFLIIQLLSGKRKPEYFLKNRVPDEDMLDLRKIYFN